MKMELSEDPSENINNYYLECTLQEMKWLLQSEKSILRNQERYWVTFPIIPTAYFRDLLTNQLREEIQRESRWVSENEIEIELLDKEESIRVKKEKALQKIEEDREKTEFLENMKLHPPVEKQGILVELEKPRNNRSRSDGRRGKNSSNPPEELGRLSTASKQMNSNSFRGWGNLKIQKE